MAWLFTLLTIVALVVCSLAIFAIGLVVGADWQRKRILAQLAEQLREDGAESFRRVRHV